MSLTQRDKERLLGVLPALVQALDALFTLQAAKGMPMFVVQGLRSTAQQQALFAQNRPGHTVTQADGVKLKSNHQAHADGFGHAVDLAFLPTKDHRDPFDKAWPWEDLEKFANAETRWGRLRWGGTFSFRDLDHLEMT